jgi:protein disulfide-isomerase
MAVLMLTVATIQAVNTKAVVRLTAADFDQRVHIERGWAFVKFYAPWCAHCTAMATAWADMAAYFQKNPFPGTKISVRSKRQCRKEGTKAFG